MRSSSASRTPVPSSAVRTPRCRWATTCPAPTRAAHWRHRPLRRSLGVHTFMKPVEVIEYDEEGLKALAARINAFAVSEDLPAHGECVLSRFVKDPYDKATLREQEKEAGLR